jgi:hypothetical protein
MRDIDRLRPEIIKARLNLALPHNRILLSSFLRTLASQLALSPSNWSDIDPIIALRIAYTVERLRYTSTDTMLEPEGIANWLSTLHIQRLTGLFSTVHLWTSHPTQDTLNCSHLCATVGPDSVQHCMGYGFGYRGLYS